MKGAILLIFSLAVLRPSEGAVSIGVEQENPDYPGKCVVESQSGNVIVLNDGESRPSPDRCLKIGCTVGNGQFSLEYVGCGLAAAPPGCQVVKDETLPYPGCCQPKIVCP